MRTGAYRHKRPASLPALGAATSELDETIATGAAALLTRQKPDGHFAFPLEADATIPAEYILLEHFLDRIDPVRQARMANYLRRIQGVHGGWPLFHGGELNISASVKAYMALKAAGDSAEAPHMQKARAAILAAGGAEKSNVFTRIQLALYGQVPWRAVPVMPVEIMLLPKWFPFHLDKIAYWSRTVIVPLLVLMAYRPQAINPTRLSVAELFVTPPEQVKDWHSNESGSWLVPVFKAIDGVLRATEPFFPKGLRQLAIKRAVEWCKARQNGEDGLGAIYPAMANLVMMYRVLGYPDNHVDSEIAWAAMQKLQIDNPYANPPESYCQPCLSPVWDTALAAHALLEIGSETKAAAKQALDWLVPLQVTNLKGDWVAQRPNVPAGGWAFQYRNDYYPDLDDTAVVVMAMDRADWRAYRPSISTAEEWVLGLQSKNGGWGAFDADNTHYYLNHIPFADHGALLDPPSADVSARCLSMLAQLGYPLNHPGVQAAIRYLAREQEPEGCWFGRWGTNYIYGTWSVLCALNAIGLTQAHPQHGSMIKRAVDWLVAKQRIDGGWGEDGQSYFANTPKGEGKTSTPAQTAWAMLALMAAGEHRHAAVARGVDYLVTTQNGQGLWDEEHYTAVGFPKVFYLRYHGYAAYFPLWALARYRNLQKANEETVPFGM